MRELCSNVIRVLWETARGRAALQQQHSMEGLSKNDLLYWKDPLGKAEIIKENYRQRLLP